MGVRTRIEPFDRDIAAIIADDLSPAGRSGALADTARAELARAQEINRAALGSVPAHDTFVDGRQGAPIETVRPDGTIVFTFHLLGEMFEWIEAQLILNAPVRSGRFARSFVFFADGGEADPVRAPDASEYVFLNVQPYSRKIERGQSRMAPDGVFEAVAVLAARRFGNVAKVRFSYRTPAAGTLLTGKRGDRSADRTPAIVIKV